MSDTLASAALTFTAHNIALPDGTETLRGAELVADSGIFRAALRDLALTFPGAPRRSVRVADLGCLEGGHTAAFAQAGYDATGFEVRAENYLCCQLVENRLALPNLRYVRADVRDVVAKPDTWDAVFCCGLLYHLENPVAFLRQVGRITQRLLIVQTHYSTRPDAEHEGHRGHWYEEGNGRWASWKNPRSFWLTRQDLLAVLRDAGFDLVFEQADFRDDILAGNQAHLDERSMFIGVKTR
jgi:SAM-dependent methyltransferase